MVGYGWLWVAVSWSLSREYRCSEVEDHLDCEVIEADPGEGGVARVFD